MRHRPPTLLAGGTESATVRARHRYDGHPGQLAGLVADCANAALTGLYHRHLDTPRDDALGVVLPFPHRDATELPAGAPGGLNDEPTP